MELRVQHLERLMQEYGNNQKLIWAAIEELRGRENNQNKEKNDQSSKLAAHLAASRVRRET